MRHHYRRALFKNLIVGLIHYGRVRTTKAKAKAIQGLVDKLITQAKSGSLHARRLLGSFLNSQAAVNKLVDDIAVRFKDRTSGYTRLAVLGNRRGDNSQMVKLEFVNIDTTEPIRIISKKTPTKPKKSAKSQQAPKKLIAPRPAKETKVSSQSHRTQSKG